MSKQRHHFVQEKYLSQWRKSDSENQLHIFSIPENKFLERGPNWKGFYKKNFNVLDEDQENFYLPEEVTATIDSRGISTIRSISTQERAQLSGEERSVLAHYVALQYIRTPRYREEVDKIAQATLQHFMREDISSPDKVRVSKKELLKHQPTNKEERKALEDIRDMSEEDIKKTTFEFLHSEDFRVSLTRTGHSKGILKIGRLAKDLFELQWIFLIAPRKYPFVTSDNPCFSISSGTGGAGLLSPQGIVFFPLRPDLSIAIKPSQQSRTEGFLKLRKRDVREVNRLTFANSYQCVVAKNLKQLKKITRKFDYQRHRKSRGVSTKELGDYVIFDMDSK